jgi:hypothetical protein
VQDIKGKGDRAERTFASWLRLNGFPDASRTHAVQGRQGFRQFSDIAGVEGFNLEVKNRKEVNIGAALLQATDGVNTPVCVVKPYGVVDPGAWWAITYVRYMADWWL